MLKRNLESFAEFDEVFDWLMAQAQTRTETESVALSKALGRVLAEPVYSPMAMPPWRQAAMDGYAYATGSDEEWLGINRHVYAGDVLNDIGDEGLNEAVAIMTGAPVPDHLDAILPVEKSFVQRRILSQGESREFLLKPEQTQVGKHIREAGSEIAKEQLLLPKGQKIGARELALLASVGVTEVKVSSLMKVVLLTTGNELVAVGDSLSAGQIHESNSWLISALCQSLPVEMLAVEHLADDEATTREKIEHWGDRVDAVLTIGGASKGEKDQIKSFLKRQPNSRVWQLNMKPAKPFSTTQLKRARLIALPGNPLAAFMSFQLLVKPFFYKLSGLKWQSPSQKMRLISPFKNLSEKVEWLQVAISDQGLEILNARELGQLVCLTRADGYIRVNPKQTCQVGDWIEFWSYS
ncbi:molybdopterin molybdotransferase MoeA [Thiomicrorhabdus sp. ZW0627]|uniref:molybdopterin molybdotransferase MoeA n=1 Tax=Thiomicrorhabdus sp. ZW0627 TaxID=3039774 RepID=UPI002436DF6B|nr:molybdopterin molybdotransferase MoeA [Thiomicrorhabdus sp. ZW0627]MDG6774132.1 molybdopterin molybdotransferase MoeA [Thiomicrorhabdus sp. ZW0627]